MTTDNLTPQTDNKLTKEVLVVGGGTSGWITACYLAKHLGCTTKSSIQVTLIESADVGIIGVGEGTFPTMRTTLKTLGISETDFIRETNATFKQAIKFVDWRDNPVQHANTSVATSRGRRNYYHLFDAPKGAPYFDIAPYWLQHKKNSSIPFDDFVSIQAQNCEMNLAPKKITTKEYEGLNYAYHIDAVKFGQFLRRHAIDNLGVKHIVDTVEKVNLGRLGEICSVESSVQGAITADFFIDCSGFKSILLGEALGVELISTDKHLFVDHAVTMQVPYQSNGVPIASHTISTAQEAGWTWDIGLSNRRGIGYVYSSRHTSHERAEQVLRAYVGSQAESLSVRKIPMKTGYRAKQWHKNCVGIGLAAGFLEPLESTAIAMIELAARYLCEEFPYQKESMATISDNFNEVFTYRWKGIVDFVKLHYCLSERTDTQFWTDNTNPKSIPDSLLIKLKKWSYQPPTKNDFPSTFDLFGLESHQYVLYGMGFTSSIVGQEQALLVKQKQAELLINQVNQYKLKSTQLFPKHKELLDKVAQYDLPKL